MYVSALLLGESGALQLSSMAVEFRTRPRGGGCCRGSEQKWFKTVHIGDKSVKKNYSKEVEDTRLKHHKC